MKFFAVIIAAAAVLSCTKTEVSTGDGGTDRSVPVISFSPDVAAMSKALLTPDNFAVPGSQIKVNDRFTTHEDIGSVDGDDKDDYIEAYIDDRIAEYHTDGGVSQWDFKVGDSYEDYWWTSTGTHYFSAYTWKYSNGIKDLFLDKCVTVSGKASNETDPSKSTFPEGLTYNPRLSTLVIKDWELTQDKQFDFCYATHTRRMTETNPYRPVELEMHHLFAAVQFNIVNLIPGETVTLKTLSLSGLSNNGSVTIMEDGTLEHLSTDEGIGKGFSSPSMQLEYNVQTNPFAYHGATGDSNIGADGSILMWPHDSEGLQNASAVISTSWTGDKTFSLFIKDMIEQWRSGYRYIYTIEIADRRISFSAVVVPWVTDDVTLED